VNALWFLIGCLMGGGMVLLGAAMNQGLSERNKR
jgi:LPS O-antigen subunit length determinant protein (WzzB/FepE family)